ncbi:MAG TPA: hypothetical protein VLI90_07460 [Tepidisphaeraceae bacterium]|nr:hypothetical protein [Tepidisphaeraceae bacterium]
MACFGAPGRRSFVGIFIGLSAATAMVGAGCDRSASQADQRVDQAVSQALPQMNGSESDRNAAASLLTAANGETAASLPSRIRAKEALAQSELRIAEQMLPQIERTQSEVLRLAWEIEGLAGQVQASNQVASALAKYEPSQVQSALQKQTSDIKGTDEKSDWVKTDAGSVPALSAVTRQQADLQARIADLQKTIQSLNDQRTQLLAKADQLNQDSSKQKGDKAVEIFKQSADARKQADDLVVQIDQNTEQLSRAQADLAVRNGQAAVLNDAIATIDKHGQDVTNAWQTLQQQMEAQHKQAKDLLGDESKPPAPEDTTGGATIAAKGLWLEELNKANRTRRDDAESHFNSAIGQFKDAANLAEELQRDLQQKINDPKNQNRPDATAWRDLSTALHPARFQMEQANAEVHRAQLLAGRAAEANARLQLAAHLKPILAEAKLQMPASFQDADNKVADDLKNAREQADASYKDASELLGTIAEGTAENLRQTAHIAKIFADYNWYLLSAAQGDKDAATKHLQSAQAERDVVVQGGVTPRNLPAELAVAPTTAPAAPAAPGAPTETPAAPAAPAPAPQG